MAHIILKSKIISKQIFYFLIIFLLKSTYCYSAENYNSKKQSIMGFEEFTQAINNNKFLLKLHQTIHDTPLDIYEIEVIKNAIKNKDLSFGGKFDKERNINNFLGSTLLVGGGKTQGKYGENQGKSLLINVKTEVSEIEELIRDLRSKKLNYDPYSGKTFATSSEMESYINELESKRILYKKAFSKKNQDILDRYYTLNIEDVIRPDMLASIISYSDMEKVPNNKFMNVEFENVPCDVFLNPKLYSILNRITKPGGTIRFSISNVCRRLIIPVIQSTQFGEEFLKKMRENYSTLLGMHPTYHRITIKVTNGQ